jgi:8-oxo-dGTP diphosphatase
MSPVLASPRQRAARRPATHRSPFTVDVVLLTVQDGQLAVALTRPVARSGERPRDRWVLPWGTGRFEETLAQGAERISQEALGEEPAWLEQIGAFGDGRRHPGTAEVSVAFVGLVAAGQQLPADADAEFFLVADLPTLAPRQRAMVDAGVAMVRARVGQAPVAFRLLPATFTLSELQEMYELLLDRPLHKASFRRSLQAARIVEATEEWRSEGRGRPAQLFRYAPRRRKAAPRGVRFE